MQYEVIVLAAGKGERMKAGHNKQFLTIRNVPLIIHTLRVFEEDEQCKQIILVVNEKETDYIYQLLREYPINKVKSIVTGGKERQDSVYNGLQAVKESNVLLIHDGARPFVKHKDIHHLVQKAIQQKAAVLAVPVKDTIKKVENGSVIETVERSSLWAIQTPQAFLLSTIKEAHEKAIHDQYTGTDDASLVERLGKKVAIVEGNYDNIKLTTPEDLIYAEAILSKFEQNN
ncbi:2-C-methyl-D-erythritol 4-phosphate cytidylyltransferase [Priestia megaterium]|nr:2-C-methyl-D-erythritol 4-phosphate cytidylyltransferase [Priestia megaterium]